MNAMQKKTNKIIYLINKQCDTLLALKEQAQNANQREAWELYNNDYMQCINKLKSLGDKDEPNNDKYEPNNYGRYVFYRNY
jgi:hypothetical protein